HRSWDLDRLCDGAVVGSSHIQHLRQVGGRAAFAEDSVQDGQASGGPCAICIDRDSPDESQTGSNDRVFPALLQDRREGRTPTGTLGQPECLVEGLIWPSPWHLDALLLSVALERMTVERLTLALVVVAAVAPR